MRRYYLALAVVGFVLPYYFLVSFLKTSGLDLPLLLTQLFANRISSFFAVDLISTTIVLLVFLCMEARRRRVSYWSAHVLATLLVGPSFAVPSYLYFRGEGWQMARR